MITQENSYLLLYGSLVLVIIAIVLGIWGLWPEVKRLFWKVLGKNAGNITVCSIFGEFGLACHIWKNVYLFQYGEDARLDKDGKKYLDVWEAMQTTAQHTYSEGEYRRYIPLFDTVIIEVINKLSELLKLFADSIEEQFKMQVYQTIEQLKIERDMYLCTPGLIELFGDKDQAFNVRFLEVIRCLSGVGCQ